MKRVKGLAAMVRNRREGRTLYASAEFWNRKAEQFEDSAVSLWRNQSLNEIYHRSHLRLLERHLPEVAGLRILDLGCGTGRLATELAGRGAEVVGIDFSRQAIEIARRAAPPGNPRFACRSVYELDEEGRFDAVIMFGVACVACRDRRDLLEVMRRIHRALKPGGRLVLFEAIRKRLLALVLRMSVAEFVEVMRQSGFRVEEVRDLHFRPAHQLLANFAWPGWLTRAFVRLGDAALALVGNRAMGEYKLIRATRI